MLAAILTFCGFTTIITSCSRKTLPATAPEPQKIELNCKQPAFLKPGDKVALIAPSYYMTMERIARAMDVISSWGLEPVLAPNVGKITDGQYAGTPEERLSDLRWAFQNPEIKAIICTRGGYGTIQLIEDANLRDFSVSPKWLSGYSDITTIHGLLTRAGVMSIHGTMGSSLEKGGLDTTSTLLRDLLFGQMPRYELPAHASNIEGKATGVLVGGNLCTFAPNLNTQVDALMGEDYILFVEEVEEQYHNIDRQMRILELNGSLKRCKGIILGQFTGCDPEVFTYPSVEAMLHDYLVKFGIPVLCGFPAGHDHPNLPLVMGAKVTMDVRADGATLRFLTKGQQQEIQIQGLLSAEAEEAK